MNINLELLQDGFTVLSVGFSIVFAFLVILIFAMTIMSKIVGFLNKIFPVTLPVVAPSRSISSSGDEEIAVAIAAVLMKK